MAFFVRFVPTETEDIEALFDLAPVSASDVVYDLGSGDGRLVFAALDKGAGRAVGIELNPELVSQAREAAKKLGLEGRASFIVADVVEADLSNASVVFCYLIDAASVALKARFERELRPGTRVVMESFPIKGWQPDRMLGYWQNVFYLYVMPPKPADGFQSPFEGGHNLM
jgi:16S rRNA G966 N2-methylase RsmD